MAEVARFSGFTLSHLRRAGRALQQKWLRTGPRGTYLLTEDQREELLAWLRTDYWSKKHRLYTCTWCAGVRRPHRWGGLCSRCAPRYRARFRRAGLPSSPELLFPMLGGWLSGVALVEAQRACVQRRALPPALARVILRKARALCSNGAAGQG